jgi:threonine synthase
MGVPVKLHVATNANDCMDVLIREGILDMGGEVIQTPANAMDIRNPYNVERILRLFMDGHNVASTIDQAEVGSVKIPEKVVSQISNVIASSMSVDTELIYKTIKNCWEENHYMVCPHTATGLALFNAKFIGDDQPRRNRKEPVYILSTASPFKFPETSEHLGIALEEWGGDKLLKELQQLPKKPPMEMNAGQNWFQILQNQINSIKYSNL